MLGALADYYDIKYKVIYNYDQICKEIQEGSEAGYLKYVILNMHGNEQDIAITDYVRVYCTSSENLEKCFRGINPKGKIILISCKVAKPGPRGPEDNFAGCLSKETRKTVVAPVESVYLSKTKIRSIDPIEMHHTNEQTIIEKCYKKQENIYIEIKP